MLSYVEREGGRAAVERLLARVGLDGEEERLRDERSWFSFETKMALWAAAAEVLEDPRVARHAGEAALEFSVATGLKTALRALGSPEFVYRNVVRANAKFNWAHRLEVLRVGRGHARVRYVDLCNAGYHPYDCEYTAGLLRVVPGLFGLPHARVDHPVCGARGDGFCEFEIGWKPGERRMTRDALALAASSAVLAVGGLARRGPLLPAAAVAAGGGALLCRQLVADLRRRVRTLEARVAEQDETAAHLFATLGDMSSDLRADEVLDKVSRAADLAVSGKQHVLLLADGDALVAGRHSGVPDPSLGALAAWATEARARLLEGPILVDDVEAVPALAALAEDPVVPLGSLCAAPMVFREEVLGALVALAHGSNVFLPHETAALGAYAAQAAIALSNARLVERLERQASEDPLTGLANLRAFHRACAAEFARAEREGRPVAIVALDLDHFKSINDVHGHLYGDEVLRATAAALRSVVRPHDLVARMGGEEFALLLPGADPAEAFDVAERARAAIARVPVRDRTLSSSAGVASHPQAGEELDRLLQLADRALYAAKELGRNRTVEHGHEPLEDDGAAPARRRIAALFEPGGVEVVFQPIVALATGHVVCHEALARFPGLPERPISDVFREAHRSGLGPRLETLAVRRALEQPGRPPGTLLSVNLSVSALCSEEVWRTLPADLSGLIVEVTEDEVFAGGPALDRSLARLREAGARIALDDAGAGYAGLQQLMRVRPDVLKLDRSLVAGVAADDARAALVASFASFAAQTGGVVCAEGLEEPDDLRAIADLDVTYAQGYLLGRPSPQFAPALCAAALEATAPLRGGLRTFPAPGSQEPVRAGTPAPDRAVALIAGATNAERVDLWRLDRRTGELVAVRVAGVPPEARASLAAAPARAHALATGEAGQVVAFDRDADAHERALLARERLGAVLIVPVGDAGAVRGLVVCYRTRPRPWSHDAVSRIRALAAPLAVALAGAHALPQSA